MTNINAKYGNAISSICLGQNFSKEKISPLSKFFSLFGSVKISKSEIDMDKITALIGSGPAYFFHLLQVYEKELLKITEGNDRLTKSIISNLMIGVGTSIDSGKSLEELISSVASKKGTTEAGLKSMKANKISSSFNKSIKVAIKRSKEISSEF